VRGEVVAGALLTLLAAGVAAGIVRTAGLRQAQHEARLARTVRLTLDDSLRGVTRKEIVPPGEGQSTPPDELRRRVGLLAPGTYVTDILGQQDSVLYRWPERLLDAVRVYVEPTSAAADWSLEYPVMARTVFDEWALAGFPLRFAFVYDSAGADIVIRWVERFPPEAGQRIGETERSHTSASLIAGARVVIANHDSAGRLLPPSVVAGIIRHEVGHALGLNHANDSASVMFRESAAWTISHSDRATLRLLYLVPAGSLK
jgi:hypothetical protein